MARKRIAPCSIAVLSAALAAFIVASPCAAPDDREAIVHVLNRAAFGPRAGDIEKVRQTGVQKYLEQQLYPDRIADVALAGKLGALSTITMTSSQLAEEYERPAIEARRERKQRAENGTDAEPVVRMDPERQRANLPLAELSQYKVLRAAYSERQLQEVLTDFWFNHFNVDARKGPARYLLTEYERDVIRPHVLGRFRDLLEATAKSPAMLFYLDNWMSADPNAPRFRFSAAAADGKRPRGLNENYGRELMELHTLGVDGGYTQNDVIEVARCLTGWTIANPRQGGGFRFDPRLHDEGEKIVLGHRIKAGGGIHDGEQVLDILATHDSTARFISTRLARRFVSDTPPPALVERLATTFRKTGGDLRAVMRALLTSQEFLSPDVYRAKVKTPFEFVVSAVRETGADIDDARPLVRAIQQLGMPLYQCQPPTGYSDTADAWVNAGAIVNRINFATTFAGGRYTQTLGSPEFQKR